MDTIRRGFYLLVGFTFPGFWVMHASGFMKSCYEPIQRIIGSESAGWPSFISASLIYLAVIIFYEGSYWLLKKHHP